MTAPSLTYNLANGATADASQVMQNYNDLLNGITDGTKDLTISALTMNGALNVKGNTTLGDATADDVTVTGSLASTVNIKTNNSFNIGSATLGLAGIYLGNGGVGATCKVVSASHATTRTYTFPDAGAAANVVLTGGTQTISGATTITSTAPITSSNSASRHAVDTPLATGSGKGTVNTSVVVFTTVRDNNGGSDITYTHDTSAGDKWVVSTAGLYLVTVTIASGSNLSAGITVNSTADPSSLNWASLLAYAESAGGFGASCAAVAYLAANDVVRVTASAVTIASAVKWGFRITKVM